MEQQPEKCDIDAQQNTDCAGGFMSSSCFRIGRILVCVLLFVAVVVFMPAPKGSDDPPYDLQISSERAFMAGETMGRIPFSAIITHDGVDEDTLRPIAGAMWSALVTVNGDMNPYDPASDLARLNAAPSGQKITLAPELFELLVRARRLTEQTDRAFDPAARPLFELWKACGRQERVPTESEILAARQHCGWQHFLLDEDTGSITKDDGDAQIDLGAIAKGYAADMALAAVRAGATECQPDGALIEVGGELAIFGSSSPQGDVWTIGINDPFEPDMPDGSPRLFGKLDLDGLLGIATSGDYRRYFEIDGVRYSHILDPRSGQPVGHVHSVTVIAPNCETADALATALSVMGEAGFEQISAMPGVEVFMIIGEQEKAVIKMSEGFKKMLRGGQFSHLRGG